eukprot:5240737-Amphidinium_carterae.2
MKSQTKKQISALQAKQAPCGFVSLDLCTHVHASHCESRLADPALQICARRREEAKKRTDTAKAQQTRQPPQPPPI